jgi:FdhD protein
MQTDQLMDIQCVRIEGRARQQKTERIARESYLELYIDDVPIEKFSFSAGHERHLVVGYLLSSGIIGHLKDIERFELKDQECRAWISSALDERPSASEGQLQSVGYDKLLEVSQILKHSQPNHRATRGFHAAIIMELTTGKRFTCEDIGRHNAVDKVIGYCLEEDFNLTNSLLILTGRLMSNIVHKGVNAGLAVIASLTVATDRGIQIAKDTDMTLIGGLSEKGSWLYHEGRTKIIT